MERLVLQHLVEHREYPLSSGEAQPLVLIVESEPLALGIRTRLLRRVEQEVLCFRANRGIFAEMVHESLRLREAPGKAHLQAVLSEWRDVYRDGDRQTRIQR